jgi:hypothetical protein
LTSPLVLPREGQQAAAEQRGRGTKDGEVHQRSQAGGEGGNDDELEEAMEQHRSWTRTKGRQSKATRTRLQPSHPLPLLQTRLPPLPTLNRLQRPRGNQTISPRRLSDTSAHVGSQKHACTSSMTAGRTGMRGGFFSEEVKKGGGCPEQGSNPSLRVIFHPRFAAPLLHYIHSTSRFPRLYSRVDSPPLPSKA